MKRVALAAIVLGCALSPCAAQESKDAKIVLLDAGKGEQRALRYHPSKGDARRVTLTTATSMAQRPAGQDAPLVDMPTSEFVVVVTVSDVFPDGNFKTSSQMLDVRIDDDSSMPTSEVERARHILTGAVGIKGWSIVSDRGEILEFDREGGGEVSPELALMLEGFERSLGQTFVPLPQAPVALGARWEQAVTIETNNIDVVQTTRYELVGVDGDLITLNFTVEQTPIDRSVPHPFLKDATVNIDRWQSTGEGMVVFSLAEPAPRELRETSDTDAQITVASATMEQSLAHTVKMELTLEATESGN